MCPTRKLGSIIGLHLVGNEDFLVLQFLEGSFFQDFRWICHCKFYRLMFETVSIVNSTSFFFGGFFPIYPHILPNRFSLATEKLWIGVREWTLCRCCLRFHSQKTQVVRYIDPWAPATKHLKKNPGKSWRFSKLSFRIIKIGIDYGYIHWVLWVLFPNPQYIDIDITSFWENTCCELQKFRWPKMPEHEDLETKKRCFIDVVPFCKKERAFTGYFLAKNGKFIKLHLWHSWSGKAPQNIFHIGDFPML